ncbi:hypothetical protein WMY93_021472 [Mugilogobius chulae]|uniref:L1 transposable element RRM domain-containing protein n=1 Tax=Mugilogobius chulae TaxID=88201 RepID=A0AAW0NLB5_9GOBI
MDLRSRKTKLKPLSAPKTKKTPCLTSTPQNMETSLETSLKTMLSEFKEEITSQIKEVRTDLERYSAEMKSLRQDVNEMRCELSEAEQRIHQLETREGETSKNMKHMQQEQAKMIEKLEYLENKSRQNNIRIYQVKEGLEGNDVTGLIVKILKETLGIPTEEIIINAAHRSLAQKPPPEKTPRSLVVRFQEWRMRQRVLQAAWAKKEIVFGGNRIYFSQDFSAKTQADRSRYGPIRKQLRDKDVKSHILFPAKLRVIMNDNVTIYKSPEEAVASLTELGILTADPRHGIMLRNQDTAGPAPFQKA